jgi:hypothetical protein
VMARRVIAWVVGVIVMFFVGLCIIALCRKAALGETVTMLITVPLAAAIGASTIYWLAKRSGLRR